MSILIDENTRLIVQGITGREGTFHTQQMLAYGTKVVAGVTPGKGGQQVQGVPVFHTVREAALATRANAAVIFVPARFTADSVKDMMECYHLARWKGARLFGPNSFGVISPGKSKAGFMAHKIFSPGHVGIMSRSATNCYETVHMLTANHIGQSTCVGNGGDMIPGSTFADILPDFQADPDTKAIVLIGEIGGIEEELAAAYIKEHVTKPVIALIAGKNAPPGRSMGHAGAIVSTDGTGSAAHKEQVLREAGVIIAESTQHIADLLMDMKRDGLLSDA